MSLVEPDGWAVGGRIYLNGNKHRDPLPVVSGPGTAGAPLPFWFGALDDLARAWQDGYTAGHSNAMRRMSDEPNAPTSPNPYDPQPVVSRE